jgi:hypothetical protein
MRSQISTYVISSLVTAPISAQLATLADIYLELSVKSADDLDSWIQSEIAANSAVISRYCNRVFGLATWQDQIRLQRGIWGEGTRGGASPLMVKHWPLVAVTSISETIAGVTTQLVAGTDYEVETGSMLPGDENPGRIWRLNENGNPRDWSPCKIVIVYEAGYSLPNDPMPAPAPTLPADVEKACIKLVTKSYWTRGQNPALKVRDQAGNRQEFWIPNTPDGYLTPDIEELLKPYRVPVFA